MSLFRVSKRFPPIEAVESQTKDDLQIAENGAYIFGSEWSEGERLFYCSACYRREHKLYPLTQGSMRRDLFCPNCKSRYNAH